MGADETESKTDAPGVATRRAALRLLDAVLRRGSPLEMALDKASQGLSAPDRALAHAIAASVLRHLVDLDAAIDSATQQNLPDDAKARMALRIALAQALILATPPHAAISTVLPLVDGGPRKLVHGVFGALLRREVTLPAPPTLPADLALRWEAAWGPEMVAAASRAIAQQPPLDLSFKAEPTEELPDAIALAPLHRRLPLGAKLTELPGFAEGDFWVQDISASLPARLLGKGANGKGGRRVLDLCAAPGGKTMQLAAAGWAVTALDLAEPRLKRLRSNLKRTGLSAETIAGDALTFSPAEPFDAVLLDAPCSATGIFRRHPDVIHRVRPKAVSGLAERQQAILTRAAMAVKPGGTLVYAVCSLEPAEGEGVIEAFLAVQHGFAIDPVRAEELPAGFEVHDKGWVRVLPGTLEDAGGADGFFIARLVRNP